MTAAQRTSGISSSPEVAPTDLGSPGSPATTSTRRALYPEDDLVLLKRTVGGEKQISLTKDV